MSTAEMAIRAGVARGAILLAELNRKCLCAAILPPGFHANWLAS